MLCRLALLLILAGWATTAIYYSNLPTGLRQCCAGLYGGWSLFALVARRRDPWARWGFLASFAGVLLGWLAIPPSNDRDWQPDLKTLAWAEISDDRATIHNIRNADYRTETDFRVQLYDRTFDLAKLRQVDCFLIYWGSPLIAHANPATASVTR